MRFSASAAIAIIAAFTFPLTANAAVGDNLAKFTPSPSGNGRGVEMASSTSRTAYYATYGSENVIYKLDMKSHANSGQLTTNLNAIAPGTSFGALAWDPANGVLWGTEFSSTAGYIDRIDPVSGAVTRAFNARDDDLSNTMIDGLAVDADGTLWVSADGLGQPNMTVYHYSAAGAVLGSFVVPFGNSGIAVDGDYLWLADIDGRNIRRYDKSGNYAGVTISTAGADIDPEDLTIDRCTFTGKKAIWTYDADFASAPLAAFEIGDDNNSGCPADPASTKPPGPPTAISVPSAPTAGAPITLDATSGDDPLGTLYVYQWDFGHGRSQVGGGVITHTFPCAGFYTVRVTVLSGVTVVARLRLNLTVSFPRSAVKQFRGLLLSPVVRLRGRRVTVTLQRDRIPYGGRRARVRSTTFVFDRHVIGKGRYGRTKIRRNRRHSLRLRVGFKKTRKQVRIAACLYA